MNRADTDLAELAGGLIHDIKGGLGTLSLQLQVLMEEYADPQTPRERRTLERFKRIKQESERLVSLSEDFLRFARTKDLDRRPTDLFAVCDELRDFFVPTAAREGIEFKSYVPAGLMVAIDRELFKQAMLNLLQNAQHAMPKGGELTLQAQREQEAVVLNLIDTGVGMTPEVLAQAFKPFYTTRHGQGGTGLGLAMTRKIIELHGGTITALSEVGKGTRFSIRLPISAGQGTVPSGLPTMCLLNGVRMPLSEAKVPVLDRGFVFGDGIYEVLRFYEGKAWLADDHFGRLKWSLAEVRIGGVDVEKLRRQAMDLIASGPYREGIVYIQITRGVAPRGHAFPGSAKPTELIWVQETGDSYASYREKGMTVSLQPDLRWKRCDVKSVNLLGNVLANQAAKEAGGHEAILYLPDGTITEASHSALFGVLDGVIRTTPLNPGILPSVTRKFVMGLIEKLGLPVEERSLTRDELPRLSEMFLGGTSLEVCPIVKIDAQMVGDGKVGLITGRLQEAYAVAKREFLS